MPGGGAATNTGIDYQQRLAAYFLIQMLLDVDSLAGIGLDGVYPITEVSFESSSCIDDIVIKTNNGTLYIQAKRNISMSDNVDSEFQKTINQFVSQYLLNAAANDKYVIATSSGSSSKIKQDLRKILESIRLNDTDFNKNPLNQSEQEVYTKLKNCVSVSYKGVLSKGVSDTVLTSILKKVHVVIADVQKGMPLEGAILTVLMSKSKVKPELFLSATISLALSLASNRQSINKTGLESKLGNYIGSLTPEKKESIELDFFNFEIANGDISSGREVLLVESFLEGTDFIIAELIRFDDAGNKRVKFHGNVCELLNGSTWKVLYRAATYAGIERYIEEYADLYKDKKIAVLPINTNDDVENSIFSIAHQDLCRNILKNKEEKLRCLHCGDYISENGAPLIEVDEVGAVHALGLVHKRCSKPLDRVLGIVKAQIFEDFDYLKDFDYYTWFKLVQKGQALFASLRGKLNQVVVMAWHPEGGSEFQGNYCVKINLKDGSSMYAHHRGKVVRLTLSSATEQAKVFNSGFEKAKQKGDPSCYTSNNESFSSYSLAIKMKNGDEECIECVNAEVARYTLAIEKAYDRSSNYYAPVIVFLDKESGQPIIVKNTVFIMDNPLKLNTYMANWSKADITLPEYKIEIIKSDYDFDTFISKCFKNGLQVIANPLFDMIQNPLSGIVFQAFEEIAKKKQES